MQEHLRSQVQELPSSLSAHRVSGSLQSAGLQADPEGSAKRPSEKARDPFQQASSTRDDLRQVDRIECGEGLPEVSRSRERRRRGRRWWVFSGLLGLQLVEFGVAVPAVLVIVLVLALLQGRHGLVRGVVARGVLESWSVSFAQSQHRRWIQSESRSRRLRERRRSLAPGSLRRWSFRRCLGSELLHSCEVGLLKARHGAVSVASPLQQPPLPLFVEVVARTHEPAATTHRKKRCQASLVSAPLRREHVVQGSHCGLRCGRRACRRVAEAFGDLVVRLTTCCRPR